MKSAPAHDLPVLTRSEKKTLRKIQHHPGIHIPLEESEDVKWLYSSFLIRSASEGVDSFGAPIMNEHWSLSRDGTLYIEHLDEQNKALRKEHLHDWRIAIFSALAGALLSRPLWAFMQHVSVRLINRFTG